MLSQTIICLHFLFQLDPLVPRKSGNVKEEMHSRRLCGLKWWMCKQSVMCKLIFILPGTACLWCHIQPRITNISNKQACLFPFEQTRVFPRIVCSFGQGWKVNWSPVCLKTQAMVHLQANPGVVWLRCRCKWPVQWTREAVVSTMAPFGEKPNAKLSSRYRKVVRRCWRFIEVRGRWILFVFTHKANTFGVFHFFNLRHACSSAVKPDYSGEKAPWVWDV